MDSLANLKDIHLPPAISWWPLAMGWYILLTIVILMGGSILYQIYHWKKNKRFKVQALKILNNYHENFKKEQNTSKACSQLSELLKQVALIYFPRDEVASLRGEEWILFLNKTSKKLDFDLVRRPLLEYSYQKTNEIIDLEFFFEQVKKWIQQRGKPCLK